MLLKILRFRFAMGLRAPAAPKALPSQICVAEAVQALNGLAPGSRMRHRTRGENNIKKWGSGGHALLGGFPLRGSEGVTIAHSTGGMYTDNLSRKTRNDTMMGADAPMPPVMMNGRRPDGCPAAA